MSGGGIATKIFTTDHDESIPSRHNSQYVGFYGLGKKGLSRMCNSPGYPKSYIKYESSPGQSVFPFTVRTLSNRESHFPLD